MISMCFLLKFSTFAYYSVLIRQRFFQIGLETLPVQWINILAVRLSAIVSLYVQSSHFILAFYFIVNYCICCWSFHLTNIQGGPKKVKPQTWLSRALYSSSSGMTKYRKGPQRTAKDHKWALRAKLQEIGTNWTQCCLIFQCAPRFFTCCRT